MKYRKVFIFGLCTLIIISALIGNNIKQSYAIKDKISALIVSDSIENSLERSEVQGLLSNGLSWAESFIGQESQSNKSELTAIPSHMGNLYKVYYMNTDALLSNPEDIRFSSAIKDYFWECPVMTKDNKISTTCTFGKYNGKWEPCLIGSGLPTEVVQLVSNPEAISDFLFEKDIKKISEIKHVRFISPWGFDALYLSTTDNAEYLIPLNSAHGLRLENQKVYLLNEVVKIMANDYKDIKDKSEAVADTEPGI